MSAKRTHIKKAPGVALCGAVTKRFANLQAETPTCLACRNGGENPGVRTVLINGRPASAEKVQPDWTRSCMVCGAKPILPATLMCGPCTFGEADTSGGNW